MFQRKIFSNPYLAATETTEDRTLDALDDDGNVLLLMAEEEDSNILLSQIGDKPSDTVLLAYGTDGEVKDEDDEVDWLLLLLQLLLLAHSSTRPPGFTDEKWLAVFAPFALSD